METTEYQSPLSIFVITKIPFSLRRDSVMNSKELPLFF